MKQIYDMLKLENIKILAGVKDWKEAIYSSSTISRWWIL